MPDTMRAVVKPAPGPGAELRDVPIPRPGPHEALVKIRATSMCGTDLHIYRWDPWAAEHFHPTPMVFGHEYCGDIVEVGSDVSLVKVGDFVSGETHIGCGHCHLCRTGQAHLCLNMEMVGVTRPGCFAEYIAIPEENLWVNRPDLPVEIAAIQEPFGNAVHTTLSGDIAARGTLVMGCGPIGLFAVGIARAAGAAPIWAVDVNDYRLDLAVTMGATRVINSTREDPVAIVMADTGGDGADVVLEMSGAPAGIRQAFQALRVGGRISMLGLPAAPFEFDFANLLVLKGAEVHGIFGRKMFETWYRTRTLLGEGLVDVAPLITHRMSLEEFHQGIELLIHGQAGKVILYPERRGE
ncbi:MAG TPA: L-threonine 3-dehydrogenase [Thermomicrobiaceae bacterium]|nr:L-threonine 3-dehydrogenase [Thermomicrobiaceae bacterium]